MVHLKCVIFCTLIMLVQVHAWIHDLKKMRSKIYKHLATAVGEEQDPDFNNKDAPTWADIATGKVTYSPKNPWTTYEQIGARKPYYADDLFNPFVPNMYKFNEQDDNGINRLSHEGICLIGPHKLLLNPSGPTGVGDRGSNGKYGVNHNGDCVLPRFICNELLENRSKVICYQILINTRRDGRKGVQGGLLDPFESLEDCVFRVLREENTNLKAKKLLLKRLKIIVHIVRMLKNDGDTGLYKLLPKCKLFLQTDIETAKEEMQSAERAIYRAEKQLTRKGLTAVDFAAQEAAKKEGHDRQALASVTLTLMKDCLAKLTACLKRDTAVYPRQVLEEIYIGYTPLILNEIKEKAEKGIKFHQGSKARLEALGNKAVPVDHTIIQEHKASLEKFNIRLAAVKTEITDVSSSSKAKMLKTLEKYLIQLKHEVKVVGEKDFLEKFPWGTRVTLHAGYVNDENQTDLAWREAYVRLLRPYRSTMTFLNNQLECGDDAKDMEWMPLERGMDLIASHPMYMNLVIDEIEKGRFQTFSMPSPTSHYVRAGIDGETSMVKESQTDVDARYAEINGIELQTPMIKSDDLARLTVLAQKNSALHLLLKQQQELHKRLQS